MAKTPTLVDVRARRKAIASEVNAIIEATPAIQKLREEDKKMEAAEQALVMLAERLANPLSDLTNLHIIAVGNGPPERRAKSRRPKRKRKNSAEVHILEVLRESGTIWWTAAEIKAALDLKIGKNNKMSTISPTLTALVRKKGILVRDGQKVALKECLTLGPDPYPPAIGASDT